MANTKCQLSDTEDFSYFVHVAEIDSPDTLCGHCLETVLDWEGELPEEQVDVKGGGGAVDGQSSQGDGIASLDDV